MGKINVLGFDVANLIAAGEVVDRPASVMKELLENAIDAGGKKIVAEIRNGGVSMIRVTDDGCGMSPEDLPIALKRHATSKVKTAEDLESIGTLGFRGEALAAISAVSKITLVSKTREAQSGTLLEAEAGEILSVGEVGCVDGTAVTVEELFCNVPARRKFLKKDATEAQAVLSVVEKIAISHPDISIEFYIDGSLRFMTTGDGNLYNTLYAVLGREFAAKLLSVSGEEAGVSVSGYVGRSDNVRGNRNYQNTFINGRFVKSKTVMAALEKAFTSYIAPEKFPVSVLFLTVDPRLVDVNVHPSKLEVKFSDERAVFEAVYYAVRSSLENAVFRPDVSLKTPKERQGEALLHSFAPRGGDTAKQITMDTVLPKMPPLLRKEQTPPAVSPYTPPEMTPKESLRVFEMAETAYREAAPKTVATMPSSVETGIPFEKAGEPSVPPRTEKAVVTEKTVTPSLPEKELPPYKIAGVLFSCYIMVEMGDEVLLVDQHAAHERLLFEELKETMEKDGRILSQSLLLPIEVSLSAEEVAAAEEYSEELSDVGFDFDLSGHGAQLFAIPTAVSSPDAAELFVSMCDELCEGKGKPSVTDELRRERALYQIACKGAVKGGRSYSPETVEWLVKRLLSIPDITVCPHGRPVAIRMTKRELDRQFERIK